MTLKQFLLILKARYKIALYMLLGTVALTLVVSLLMPKQYTAITSLVVDTRSPDPISAMLMPGNMATQEDIIESERVARNVVKMLKLDENLAVKEQWQDATGGKGRLETWLVGLLQRRLKVVPPKRESVGRESNILNIEYTASDPVFAAAVANAFAQAYIDVMVEMKVEPAKQYARWFGEQSKSLRENLEKAQARLSEYQQKKGIVEKDETVDAETARLKELTSQLTVIQAQTTDARSKQRSGRDADTLPEVLQNSVIQGLRSEAARQEAKLKEAAGNLGTNHPQYKRMESELAELKEKLKAETRHVASGFSASGSVGKSKENELRSSIEAQKKKLLALRSERDQVAVLQRDVDAAKSAYDAVEKQHTQASLESRASHTNVFLLTPAVEPLRPSHPRYLRYLMLSILFGTMLGVGAAFMQEMLDRRIRCVDDLVAMPQMPLLVAIKSHRRLGRAGFLRRRVAALGFK